MKNFIKSIIPLMIVLLLFSCDSYLDELPDDRIELNSLEIASEVVANAYSQGSYAFTDMYTDLAGPVGNDLNGDGIADGYGGNQINPQDEQTYTWGDVVEVGNDTPANYWNAAYEAISQANEVLVVVDGLEGGDELRKAVKGEALLTRAYHHFILVNIFGMHYDASASTNLGVTYITKPEKEFLPQYTRNTVAEVYDLVEKDLLEGLSLIQDDFFVGTKKYHFTVKAAQAFASRFYLWKRDYAKCKIYSDLFLGGSPESYIKDYSSLQGLPFLETGAAYSDPADDSNALVMQQFSSYTRRTRGFRLNANDVNVLFSNVFRASDARTSIGIFNSGTDSRYLPRLREYFFQENLSSTTGTPYYIAVELKGEEVILNRAEALFYLGDETAALEDLNRIANNRYGGANYILDADLQDYYLVNTPQKAFIEALLHERKKEFWDHGLRWFDIKRYNIPITHNLPENRGNILPDLPNQIELPANDLRRAIQIPADAIAQGLAPNPR